MKKFTKILGHLVCLVAPNISCGFELTRGHVSAVRPDLLLPFARERAVKMARCERIRQPLANFRRVVYC